MAVIGIEVDAPVNVIVVSQVGLLLRYAQAGMWITVNAEAGARGGGAILAI